MSTQLFSQAKNDIVVLANGERKEGKVTGITDSQVKFRYVGEEFDYEFSKSDVAKIEFGSGRVETFGTSAAGGTSSISPKSATPAGSPDTHNKVAVLPFEFVSNDGGMDPEAMSKMVQNNTANLVRDEYRTLTLQDPLTTNAILGKNNINHSNISSNTPDELAKILGVEFVIFGTLSITNKGASTYGGTGTTYKEKETDTYNNNKNTSSTKGSGYTSTSSTTTINYDTMVDFRMFNDRGDNLYSESRHVFGTTIDSYKGGMEYMIRRTPFGSKYGKK
ncbi:hypothetical protein [Algoriphagus sp. A40]|uniref:hypothetical protein n=1 Tax=Algoriphagus sp. A40 TaxID=1945863 RepID=UPI0011158CF9|nr:hypothetical protein [Algoriphagus sp. A40]